MIKKVPLTVSPAPKHPTLTLKDKQGTADTRPMVKQLMNTQFDLPKKSPARSIVNKDCLQPTGLITPSDTEGKATTRITTMAEWKKIRVKYRR